MEMSGPEEISTEYEDMRHAFCSADCRDFFEKHPKWFVEKPHPHLSTRSGVTVPRLQYGRAGGEFDLSSDDSEPLTPGD